MPGFTDIHHHLVFGMDDGPASFEQTYDMLLAACADGIRHIISTPHVFPGSEAFDYPAYLQKLAQINARILHERLPLSVHPGAELYYTDAALRLLKAAQVPTLAESRHVLVEFSPDVPYEHLFDSVRRLSNGGFMPIIAHIERYACLARDARRLHELKRYLRVQLQVNCSSVVRHKSFRTRRFLAHAFSSRLIDYVATDAHNVSSRPVCMTECHRILSAQYGAAYADSLTGLDRNTLLLRA